MKRFSGWIAYVLAIIMLLPSNAYGYEKPLYEGYIEQGQLKEAVLSERETTFSYPANIVERDVGYDKKEGRERPSSDHFEDMNSGTDLSAMSVGTLAADDIIVNGMSIFRNLNASYTGWSYDASTETLTLDGYNGSAITTSGDLVVYVKSNSTIRGSNGTWGSSGIVANNLGLNIEAGKLLNIYGGNATSYAGGDGIYADSLEFNVGSGASVNINGGSGADYWGGYGIDANSLEMDVGSGASVNINGGSSVNDDGGRGIYADILDLYMFSGGNIKIKGGNTTNGTWGGDGIYGLATYIYTYDYSGNGVLQVTGGRGNYGGDGLYCNTAYIRTSANQGNSITGGSGVLNGGNGILYTQELYFDYGQKLSVNGGTPGGYGIATFTDDEYDGEWYYSEHLNDVYTATSVVFSPKVYTITLDGNGGMYNSKSTIVLTGQYPDWFEVFDYQFQKNGYHYIGWTSELFPNQLIPIDVHITFNANKTFYAQYAPVEGSKVLLISNRGLINGNNFTYINRGDRLPDMIPADQSLSLVGWTDDLMENSVFEIERTMGINELFYLPGTENIQLDRNILYSQVDSSNRTQVNYHGNGGVTQSGSDVVVHTLTSNSDLQIYDYDSGMFKYTGYDQVGWNSSPLGEGTNYPAGYVISERVTRDIFAQWGPTPLHAAIITAREITEDKVGSEIIISQDGRDVLYTIEWTTQSNVTALEDAISSAEIVMNNPSTTELQANAAKNALNNAISTFNANVRNGSRIDATSISLNRSTGTIGAGQSLPLIATLSPSNNNDTVTWSSNNTSVATVSAEGIVEGAGEGVTTITAETRNGITATCTVTVLSPKSSLVASLDSTASGWEVNISVSVYDIVLGNDNSELLVLYTLYKDGQIVRITTREAALSGNRFDGSETIEYPFEERPDTCKAFILRKNNMKPIVTNPMRNLQ